MVANKKSFFDVVARPTTVQSQSGYVNQVESDIWELRGRQIDYGLLADAVTEGFLKEIKHQFATVMQTHKHADSSFQAFFIALKDCIHFSFRGTGVKVNALSSAMISEWRDEASGRGYPYTLKSLIIAVRAREPKAFPNVTNKVMRTLKRPQKEVQHILSLDPKKGPWLEREVLDQDRAIEQAYTSGAWHVEKYVLVQLFRFYGVRPEQVANMKIADVRCRHTGHAKAEIRWPFAKNDLTAAQALWWPLGGALLPALEAYFDLRLDGIPRSEQERLPLFTPEGLPGVWRGSKKPKPNREPGYEGHPMSARGEHALQTP
ncbi:hypothetical protein [Primorskyibacter sp. 2E233]|uniref:hypothetical protein n=1 Tax=Primorskyibacter sp. 2E233 TaxID=3413431 RepID=UPI003BF43EA2